MHMVVFTADRSMNRDHLPELWIFTQPIPYLPWWKRVWFGLKLMFGYGLRDPFWSETLADYEQIKELAAFFNEIIEKNKARDAARDARVIQDLVSQSRRLREHAELLAMTRLLESHPDGYDGPCECQACQRKEA